MRVCSRVVTEVQRVSTKEVINMSIEIMTVVPAVADVAQNLVDILLRIATNHNETIVSDDLETGATHDQSE